MNFVIDGCIYFIIINIFYEFGISIKFTSAKIQDNSARISIKVVEDLPNNDNFGVHPGGQFDINLSEAHKEKNIINLHPAPFSGPEPLRKLHGSCFTYIDEKYKYKLCPFDNITQEELKTLQDPYKTVLGIWGEWIIENNQFKMMHFIEGMSCGSHSARSVKLNLSCGEFTRLVKVSEPSKCKYIGAFETPLVCEHGSLFVYPTLSKELKMDWDLIETEKYNDILTHKGYEEELHQIFLKAGYHLSLDNKKDLSHQLSSGDTDCVRSKNALESKIEHLETELSRKEHLVQTLSEQLEANCSGSPRLQNKIQT